MSTLTVGAGSGFEFSTLASAIAASQDGDVIQVQAGTYTNDFATITTDITITGVGGMANLVATEAPPNLMGILTIGTPGGIGPDVTLDNLSFSGAAIPNDAGGNGAGIRYQSGNLVLNNTHFFDNQDGLLGDADPTGIITINNSQFNNNGNANPPASGVEHNLYVGAIQQLTIDNSYFTDPIVGHDIKSRAANTTVENSTIADPTVSGSLEIDLPNGGNALIENNIIEKGPNAQNSNFISSGEEGPYPISSLIVTGNTVLNDAGAGQTFVVNDTSGLATLTNNTFYGTPPELVGGSGPFSISGNIFSDSTAPALPPPPFACFVAGTRILTPGGQVPVEALRVGQRVVIVGSDRERAVRSIRWIGHRHIDFSRHADPKFAQPIRIRAGAFAEGEPLRDLLVSPDHAIYADGMLIPARLLRNGTSIVREDRCQAVRYFHVELDRHEILLAENLPVESYLDTGNRGLFENSGMPLTLHPDFSGHNMQLQQTAGDQQARRESLTCAPFAADAERVEPVWRRLAMRASQLGFVVAEPATTTDPALRLLVDGREVWPLTRNDDRHVFILPRSATAVRLISRSTAPCDVAPWVEDRRRLGVAVGRIVLTGTAGSFEMAVDHPSLADGWWATEREGLRLRRWTNGNAALPLSPGVAIVEIHLTGESVYLRSTETDAALSLERSMVA